jgi:hypothetical protein
MKQRLLTNWNLWRVIRLILSFIFVLQGILKEDYIVLAAGVFLLIHAILNSCVTCVTDNCKIPQKK